MIVGGHITIASSNPDADTAFFRDMLKLPNVDAGGGYIIFGLPACEVAVHGGKVAHTLHLMCEDMDEFRESMKEIAIATSEPQSQSWGIITELTLPGGDTIHVYQPSHKHPPQATARRKPARKPARKPTAKKKAVRKTAKSKAPARKTKKKAKRR